MQTELQISLPFSTPLANDTQQLVPDRKARAILFSTEVNLELYDSTFLSEKKAACTYWDLLVHRI